MKIRRFYNYDGFVRIIPHTENLLFLLKGQGHDVNVSYRAGYQVHGVE